VIARAKQHPLGLPAHFLARSGAPSSAIRASTSCVAVGGSPTDVIHRPARDSATLLFIPIRRLPPPTVREPRTATLSAPRSSVRRA
jgi:hypothetical protein